MTSSKIRLITIAASVLLTIGLFGAGYKNSTGVKSSGKMVSVSFEDFLASAKQQLNEDELKFFSGLEQQLSPATAPEAQTAALRTLVSKWDSLGRYNISAHYAESLAERLNNETSWMDAGNRYFEALRTVSDSNAKVLMNEKTITIYRKVLALNPANIQAKNNLGVSIIEQGDVMSGVKLLKEVVAADPDNRQAIYTLGFLSIRSGQLDKAAERFEKLVSIDPANPEYHYYLGEVYEGMGQKDKAIKEFETCKRLLIDEVEINRLEMKIKELKNT